MQATRRRSIRSVAPLINRIAATFFRKPVRSPEGHRHSCAVALGFALACLRVAVPQACAQEAVLQPMALHVGFTRSSFRNVNASDATAAFRVFAQTAARKRGYQLDTDARLFDSPELCEEEIKKGTINMAVLDTLDYLGMDIGQAMDPVFVHLEQGRILKDYLLLCHKASGMTNLANLRGKDLMLLEGKGGNLSRAWLDRALRDQHLEAKEIYFRQMEAVTKPVAAILPVFFGTRTACVVDRGAFQIMTELNPQVGNNLAILAISEPFLENVTCVSKSGWPSERTRQDLLQAMAELHNEPSGRQILELFKLDQMVPFKEDYLKSVRNLRAASQPWPQRDAATLPGGHDRSQP